MEGKMMKNSIKILFAATVAVTALASCSKFDKMNKNPYAIYDAPSEEFVQPIIFQTEKNLMSSFRNTVAFLMQYSISTNTEQTSKVVSNYNIPEAADDDIWVGIYPQFGNAEYMANLAAKEKNPAMLGVANILKVLTIYQIADTYGNVPFTEAGKISLQGGNFSYITKYDEMKSIYQNIFLLLEQANERFNRSDCENFSALCDYMYNGDYRKWQRFGNSLYLRLLNRVALKVIEEDGGSLALPDGSTISILGKMAELYDCFKSGYGNYPVMRGREDGAVVGFSEDNASLQSPFYSTTSGTWNSGGRACETLAVAMNETSAGEKEGKRQTWTYYSWSSKLKYDPRWDCYFHKTVGAPTQLKHEDISDFFDYVISSSGNSLVGSMVQGQTSSITTGLYPEKGLTFNVKNPDGRALMNYSELLFIFAEAGIRGWLPITYPDIRSMYINAITENILEWRKDLETDTDGVISQYTDWRYEEFNVDNALEKIMEQKWISMFFVGIESWCDYRRTGYPILNTNGPAAENDGILPTRLRYPADEAYRNQKYHEEQVNGWLGGKDNIQTEVWWADTKESVEMRKKGRQ